MEASGELDGGILDCSVGTIVWVRRRNGSWWPGRILGPHELSASHLMSPRSGTPVKLLGREDASVDWYNLEKSKRVKAFRCGEFDACIERAEASHGVPIKKREKYARREDAILHALELEKQQIEKRQRKLGSNFNYIGNNSSVMKKKLSSCSPSRVHSRNVVSIGNDQFVTPKLEQLSSRVDLPLQDASCGNSLFVQKGKNDKQHNGENVKSEVIPRMRGLQDFGLRIAPSKKKLTASVSYENSREAVSVDNHERVLPGSGHGMGGLNYTGNGKSYSSFKRRRSEGVPVESLVKRRDRRRPLVQVLQSSAKLPLSHSLMSNSDTVSVTVQEEKEHVGAICRSKRSRCVYVPADSRDHLDPNGYSSDHMQISPINSGYGNSLLYPGSVAEENTSSGVIEGDESDLSERDCLDPDTEEEEILHPAGTQILESRTSGEYVGNCIPSFMVQESFGNTKNGEEPLSGYISHLHPRDQNAGTSADGGVSKWHMKGKRNIRSLSKKSMGVMDGKFSDLSADKFDGPINVTEYESKRSTFKMGRERASRKVFCHRSEDYVYDEDDFVEKDLDSPPLAFDGCRYPLMLKAPLKVCGDYNIYSSDEDSPSHWEAEGLHHASQGVYQQADECYDPVYDGLEPMLLDVNLEVQATYQGERVPLVSLMSRLNGKAIIGHPIQIEILEDGSTDQFSRNDAREDPSAVEGSAAPPPVWRTGRRTAMQRVPRPHSTPSALDGGETDPHPYSNFEGKPPLNKAHTAHFNYQDKLMKNSHRSMSGKLQKKLLKKVSLSGLKTRTLSSFATEQKHSGENDCSRHTRKNSSMLNGLIKPDDTMPSVTSVPVKVVFSRILETVGRPPSAAGTHQFLLTGSIDVNPS